MEEDSWKAEYAPSSRASCRACSQKIEKGELRFGFMVRSPTFDGVIPHWHHDSCFLRKPKRISSVDEVAGFDSLRWEDQQRIERYVEGKDPGKAAAADADGDDGLAEADEACAEESEDDTIYEIEHSKSSRAACKECNEKIAKGAVRVSMVDGKKKSRAPAWRHVKCFLDSGCWKRDVEEIPGFEELDAEGQEMVRGLVKPAKELKRKAEANEDDGPKKKKQVVEETGPEVKQGEQKMVDKKKLEAQSKALWKLIDDLKNNVSKDELKEMLYLNYGTEPKGVPVDEIRDRCADGMMFGPLVPCTQCGGTRYYSSGRYKCSGHISEWTRCSYTSTEVARSKKKWRIPDTNNKFLEQWFKKQPLVKPCRLLRPQTAEESKFKRKDSLEHLDVLLTTGLIVKTKEEWKEIIEGAGATVRSSVAPGIIIVSTKEQCEKENPHVQAGRGYRLPVVSERYLEDCFKNGKKLPTSEYLIELNKLPEKTKVIVKGRSAVHEESNMQDKGHILEVGKHVYSVTLSRSDIAKGINSYYILQIIEEDRRNAYHVFRKWGRVGEDIGNHKTESFPSREAAINNFQSLFFEKTENHWPPDNFQKKPGKFFMLEIDYGAGDEAPQKVLAGLKSKLNPRVVDLLKMLFDIETYKAAMLEFEINTTEMPLGKLTKRHIELGFGVLTEIQTILHSGQDESRRNMRLADASNRFFTLIPTIRPTVISDPAALEEKNRMLEALRDIEIASQLINAGEDDDEIDPLDLKYQRLRCDISPLPHDSHEFKLVKKYLETTHAPTHTEWGLEVEDVFAVNREGERDLYTPKKSSIDNHMLLWHGSRTTNFVGILSQGLRIAPPEAPATGYMFGKGVYFADLVSKSAQYCYSTRSNPLGLMLLSEVALGKMKELTRAQYMDKPLPGYDSTKGQGKMVPDPTTFETLDNDVVVPCGKPIRGGISSDLQYNEYIVYDTSQVNLRYLLKVRFKYKW